ncbi:metallophosphoesterase family protein [Haloferax marisrubri]|nr:metallophosphoesterase [Haloferax marisrubri]
MECLVIGDVHLGAFDSKVDVPETWGEYDVAVVVGDVLDCSARSCDSGRRFFEELDDLGLRAVVVPGNHDFQHYPAIFEGLSSVESVDGSATTVDGWTFYGLGSDRFDDGVEIRYPEFPSLADADADPAAFAERIEDVAVGRQSGMGVVEDHLEGRFEDGLQLYERRLESLNKFGQAATESNTVVVTHLPPFGTGLDRLSKTNPRYPGRLLGSLAVRSHIRQFSPDFNVCGHVHEGEGVTLFEGCVCLNAGKCSVYSITLGEGGTDAVSHIA